MVSYVYEDDFRDTTGAPHNINGQLIQVPGIPGDRWKAVSVHMGAAIATFTQSLVPKSLLVTSPNAFHTLILASNAMSNHQFDGFLQYIVECSLQVDPKLHKALGCGLIDTNGTGAHFVFQIVRTATDLRQLYFLALWGSYIVADIPDDMSDLLALRMSLNVNGEIRCWVADIDRNANPNRIWRLLYQASYKTISTDAEGLQPNTACGLHGWSYNTADQHSPPCYYSPVEADGTVFYKFRAKFYTDMAFTALDIKYRPYGGGWIGEGEVEFYYVQKHAITLPTALNDSAILFSTVEINNINNINDIFVEINQRTITIPGGATVTVDFDPALFPYLTLTCNDGKAKITLFAKVDVKYQYLR